MSVPRKNNSPMPAFRFAQQIVTSNLQVLTPSFSQRLKAQLNGYFSKVGQKRRQVSGVLPHL